MRQLDGFFEKHPDMPLEQLRGSLGKTCSLVTIHNTTKRLNWRYKKTLHASGRNRPDMQQARQRWRQCQIEVDPLNLVSIDASGAKTNMTRLRGGARSGLRCVAETLHGHWQTNTMILSVRLDGSTACMVVDGASIHPTGFCARVAAGRYCVLDNLAAHKDAQARTQIKAVVPN